MIYEATLFTTFAGQSCVNRWNYLLTGEPASVKGSFGLISAMGAIPPVLTPGYFVPDSMMEEIRQMVSASVSFVAVSVKAIYDVTDFYELPYVPQPTGGIPGEALSPTAALGFRTSRVRTDIRRGTKRFVGVAEGFSSSGGVISGDGAAAMAAVSAEMSEVLTYDDEGNTLSYAPIVVKKQPYIPEDSTREAYRYYPTEAEQMANIAVGILWQPYAQTRTQTSRQYGRGQ